MSIQRKGLREIKTLAGTVNRTFLPHRAYMRISCLEMERVHHLREMESLRSRIKTIQRRIDEIDLEKNILINHIKSVTDTFSANTGSEDSPDKKIQDKKRQVLRY